MTNNKGSAPHIHAGHSVNAMMNQVLLALIPGVMLSMLDAGIHVLQNCVLCVLFALICEALILRVLQKHVWPTLKDNTTIITAILFALTIPPFTPWWGMLAGMAFAIVVTKHLFGGTGYYIFNPAMAGCVFVLLGFSADMNTSITAAGQGGDVRDAMTMKMNLAARPGGNGGLHHLEIVWTAIAYLAGGFFLLIKQVIRWPIPVAVFGSMCILSTIFYFIDPESYLPPVFYLLSSQMMLCAFFIATDPTSSATSLTGKIIYGSGIGVLTYVMHAWKGETYAFAFAILIMNAFVPLIDFYTRFETMKIRKSRLR